jgi:hypothetical protein
MLNDSIQRLLTPRTARTLLLASALGLALAASAGAEAPAGPGTVFPSLEAAAEDALRFAAAQKGDSWREWGGTIERVPGGYRYGMPVAGTQDGVRIALRDADAAWYYTHGARDEAVVDRLNEGVSRRDRRMVDRVDPRRRPLFVSTPSGQLLRYGDGRLAVVKPVVSRVADTETSSETRAN